MSQMMVAVFSFLWFLYCQYVLHSSQSMVIRVTFMGGGTFFKVGGAQVHVEKKL